MSRQAPITNGSSEANAATDTPIGDEPDRQRRQRSCSRRRSCGATRRIAQDRVRATPCAPQSHAHRRRRTAIGAPAAVEHDGVPVVEQPRVARDGRGRGRGGGRVDAGHREHHAAVGCGGRGRHRATLRAPRRPCRRPRPSNARRRPAIQAVRPSARGSPAARRQSASRPRRSVSAPTSTRNAECAGADRGARPPAAPRPVAGRRRRSAAAVRAPCTNGSGHDPTTAGTLRVRAPAAEVPPGGVAVAQRPLGRADVGLDAVHEVQPVLAPCRASPTCRRSTARSGRRTRVDTLATPCSAASTDWPGATRASRTTLRRTPPRSRATPPARPARSRGGLHPVLAATCDEHREREPERWPAQVLTPCR